MTAPLKALPHVTISSTISLTIARWTLSLYSSTYLPWATPVVSGHLPCTDTLSMSRHISTLNYLRSADTCLTRTRTVTYWLSVPAITDSSNKCHVFGGHFNPKSLAAGTLTCDRHFAQMSMLPSGDRKQYFISRVNDITS